MQPTSFTAVERARRAGRIEPGAPQLIHQHRLQRRAAAHDDMVEVTAGELERVGPEAVLVGLQLDRSKTPWVTQIQRATVGEAHTEAMPDRVLAIASVDQRVA